MSFFVFTMVGIAAGVAYLFMPTRRTMGALAAIALGVVGAWTGALLVAAATRTGWASFGAPAVTGSVVGAVAALAAVGIFAARHRREAS